MAPPPPLLTKLVFEIRYADGELYWDLSGRVRRSLRLSNPKWDFSATPDLNFWPCRVPVPEGAEAKTFLQCNFGALKLDFSLEPEAWTKVGQVPFDALRARITQYSQIVLDGLSIERVTRVGLRLWQFFPLQSREAAQSLILATSYCRPKSEPPPELGSPTGGMVIDLYKVGDAESRIAVGDATVSVKLTGEQRHGVLLDIDYRVLEEAEGDGQARLANQFEGYLAHGLDYVTSSTKALSAELFGKART